METFSSVCGFFFHYSDSDIPETVKSWNVTRLPLNRAERYTDIQTVQLFFDTLTKFLDQRSKGAALKQKVLCRPDKLCYK